MLPVPGVGR